VKDESYRHLKIEGFYGILEGVFQVIPGINSCSGVGWCQYQASMKALASLKSLQFD